MLLCYKLIKTTTCYKTQKPLHRGCKLVDISQLHNYVQWLQKLGEMKYQQEGLIIPKSISKVQQCHLKKKLLISKSCMTSVLRLNVTLKKEEVKKEHVRRSLGIHSIVSLEATACIICIVDTLIAPQSIRETQLQY